MKSPRPPSLRAGLAVVVALSFACGSTGNPPGSGGGGSPATTGGRPPAGTGGTMGGATGGTVGGATGGMPAPPVGGSGGMNEPPGTGGTPSPDTGPAPEVTPPPDPSNGTWPGPVATDTLPPCGRTVMVAGQDALAPAITAAMPGDCIVLEDGAYTFPMITAKGTAAAPIVIKAANTLKAVVMTGDVIMQGAAHVVVRGIHFRSSGYIAMGDCEHCRVSRFRIERQETSAEQDWVIVRGTSKHCRIDHNDFGPQRSVGNMVMLSGMGNQVVQYTRIDHNYFHDVTYGGGNGWELIRAGLSGWTFSKAYTVIERNLFYRGDSDPETISVKSSDNVVRYNTMRATAGQFTLRHGNRAEVYGNYILGDGRGSTGLRIYGGGHKIYNNYFEGLGTGILMDSGSSTDDTGQLTDHKVTYDSLIVFNTIVGGRIAIGSGKPLPPRNITAAFNIAGSINAVGGATVKQMNNLTDANLSKMGDVFRLTPGSPAIDAAAAGAAMFPFVTEDGDGRPRDKHDIGAEELSATAPKYGILTAKDVGPLAP